MNPFRKKPMEEVTTQEDETQTEKSGNVCETCTGSGLADTQTLCSKCEGSGTV